MKLGVNSINSGCFSHLGAVAFKGAQGNGKNGEDNKAVTAALEELEAVNRSLVKNPRAQLNLKRYAKSDLRNSADTEALLKKYPDTKRYIGSLPYSWCDNVPKENMAEFTNGIFELFSDFAQSVTGSRFNFASNYKKETEDFAQKFEKATGKNSSCEYLGEGTIGRTYKLTVDGEDYAVKTFFTDPVALGYYSLHGKGAEILGAEYAKTHSPKGEFTDFYFGKFAKNDDFDGFMVTKYVDYKSGRNSYLKSTALEYAAQQPAKSGDIVDNHILDTVYDFGEIRKGEFKNKKQYKIQRLIFQAIASKDKDKFDEICAKYKGKDLDFVLNFLTKKFDSLFLISKYKGVEPLGEEGIKILTSDKHNRIFKLLHFALCAGNDELYRDVLNTFKGQKELDYVLKVYNKNIDEDKRSEFVRRVRKTEIVLLKETLEEFKIPVQNEN